MNRQQFRDIIEQFYKDNLSLIDKKNADYAAGDDPFRNFRMAEYMGLTTDQGIMLRLLDKMARLANVSAKGGLGEVTSESLDDTLQDIANYAGILYAYRRSLGNGTQSSTSTVVFNGSGTTLHDERTH